MAGRNGRFGKSGHLFSFIFEYVYHSSFVNLCCAVFFVLFGVACKMSLLHALKCKMYTQFIWVCVVCVYTQTHTQSTYSANNMCMCVVFFFGKPDKNERVTNCVRAAHNYSVKPEGFMLIAVGVDTFGFRSACKNAKRVYIVIFSAAHRNVGGLVVGGLILS